MVIPSDHEDVTMLRPVNGSDEDAVGVFAPLEPDAISEASYPRPDPSEIGDFQSALLLRDAARLTLRAGAGPFRSIGRLSFTPRPYQYAPLIMALRMNPTRMMIADDVGVGKTIEAGMVARELLDRRAVRRIGVLCPPHLCEQWSRELLEKFGIETAVIQPARMARLERGMTRRGVHVFQYYPHLVASIDYVKSDRRRSAFAAHAPDLIIVDEAHGAARPRSGHGGSSIQQQRHELLRALAADPKRHIVLVTATPHSGVEESFRSLIGLLNENLDAPVDRNIERRRLLPYLVQRRRSDLMNWLGADTPFPERDNQERSYRMSREYTRLYESILRFCRQTVSDSDGRRQRVRYWAAVAILRSVLSSPAAAEATLRRRAERKRGELAQDEDIGEDEFAAQIMDSDSDRDSPPDYAPTSALDDPNANLTRAEIRRLDGFLREARKLRGPKLDAKLAETIEAVEEMLDEGFSPIVYCRFIDTAQYVAEQIRDALEGRYPKLRVSSVTGGDGDDERRREIVGELAKSSMRVLVATDCLSEGINLQEDFDAVLHYDLPWNPNRLEQREGRVDRYGQKKKMVRSVLLRGEDNAIDLAVLRVLIRKAQEIRRRLGISVAPPVESDAVINAVIEDVFLQREGGYQLEFGSRSVRDRVSEYHDTVDRAAEQEGRNRAWFAQESIQAEDVDRELREMEPALGTDRDILAFVRNAIQRFNGELRRTGDGSGNVFDLHPGDLADTMSRRGGGLKFPLRVSFCDAPYTRATRLGRNHPVVAALSDAALSAALDGRDGLFRRCGAVLTNAVSRRVFVTLLRLRYRIDEGGNEQFAEEVVAAAFERVRGKIEWLRPYQERALGLLSDTEATGNMPADEARNHVAAGLRLLDGDDWAEPIVSERREALADSHRRLRGMIGGAKVRIQPHRPPDIIGIYALAPDGG